MIHSVFVNLKIMQALGNNLFFVTLNAILIKVKIHTSFKATSIISIKVYRVK